MTSIINFLKSAKWVLYSVLAIGVGVLLFSLRRLFSSPSPAGPDRLPDVPEVLKKKVEAAQEEALKAKVEAKLTADSDKKQVEDILKIDDGAERRKRLADKLRML
jgi:hypothetical protein